MGYVARCIWVGRLNSRVGDKSWTRGFAFHSGHGTTCGACIENLRFEEVVKHLTYLREWGLEW